MAPIRVAIVGLAAEAPKEAGVGTWGVLAHLRSLAASPHYDLVAVCNSSVASAQKSIDFHKLGSSVKAYGSTADLATDLEIDLVSISINVEKHLVAARPLLEAGKQVFMEWPLGKNIAEAEELQTLAEKNGVKTSVGVQLRSDPLVKRLKKILAEGTVGEIRSSTVAGCTSILPADMWARGAEYYIDWAIGGNEFTIFIGHFVDTFVHVLGDFSSLSAIMKNHHPSIALVDPSNGQVIDAAYPKSTPDHVFVQGELESGAIASLSFRKTPKPVDGLGMRWLISGTKGEIEVTMPEDHLQMPNSDKTIQIRVDKGEVQNITWGEEQEPEHVLQVMYPGTNTARTYEDYATGGSGVVNFAEATTTHRLLDRIQRAAGYPQTSQYS